MAERKRFQKIVTAGRFTLPLILIVSLGAWAMLYFIAPVARVGVPGYPVFNSLLQLLTPEVSTIMAWVGYILIGYILIGINNAFTVIRMRASVQTIFFILLVSVYRPLHLLSPALAATLFVLLSLTLLFRSYQKPDPQSDIFHAFLLFGIGCFLLPKLVWFTPVMLLGAWNMQALYLKSFVAAILGWTVPWWFLFGHAYFYGQMELFLYPLQEMITFEPLGFPAFSTGQLMIGGLQLFFVLISIAHFAMHGYQEKIRTRVLLGFISVYFFAVVIAVLLQPGTFTDFSPLLMVLASFLIGHFFTVTNSRGTNLLFILFILAVIAVYIEDIWMILSGR